MANNPTTVAAGRTIFIHVKFDGLYQGLNAKPAEKYLGTSLPGALDLENYELKFEKSFDGDAMWFSWVHDTLYFDQMAPLTDFFRGRYFDRDDPNPTLPQDLQELQEKLQHLAYGGNGGPCLHPAVLRCFAGLQSLRTLELDIIIDNNGGMDTSTMDSIIDTLKTAWANEEWYKETGLPTVIWRHELRRVMIDRSNSE